jgi:mono/diheme cytochrome c family protein
MTTKFSAIFLLLCLIAMPVFAVRGAQTSTPTPTPAVFDWVYTELPAEATLEATAPAATVEFTAEATASEEATAEATAAAALVGDPARGKDIFEHGLDDAPPCANCHVTTGKTAQYALAPSLAGISQRAATRVAGQTALDYIETSIRHPRDFVVPGFNPIMPSVFGQKYSDQDIADLAAYLMTL